MCFKLLPRKQKKNIFLVVKSTVFFVYSVLYSVFFTARKIWYSASTHGDKRILKLFIKIYAFQKENEVYILSHLWGIRKRQKELWVISRVSKRKQRKKYSEKNLLHYEVLSYQIYTSYETSSSALRWPITQFSIILQVKERSK